MPKIMVLMEWLNNKNKSIKKIYNIGFLFFLALALVFMLLYGILHLRAVQQVLIQKIVSSLSKKAQMDLHIRAIDFDLWHHFQLKEILLRDEQKDTLLYASSVKLDIGIKALFRKQFVVEKLTLEQPLVRVYQLPNDSVFNFSYLLTEKKDTSSSWFVFVKKVVVQEGVLAFNAHQQKNAPLYKGTTITHFSTVVDDIFVHKDSVHLAITQLSGVFSQGLKVSNLQGVLSLNKQAYWLENMQLSTPTSTLLGQIKVVIGESATVPLLERLTFDISLEKSKIKIADIDYFLSTPLHMKETIHIDGRIKGQFSDFRAKKLQLSFGEKTMFKGDVEIMGLPNIEETFVHVKTTDFLLSPVDIMAIKIPINGVMTPLPISPKLKQIPSLRIVGAFTGFYYDFVSYASFYTPMGMLKTDLSVVRHGADDYAFKGRVGATNLKLGGFLGITTRLGASTFFVDVDGRIKNEAIDFVKMDGLIHAISFNEYVYKNVDVDGLITNKTFNGTVQIDDDHIQMDFNGLVDYIMEKPIFNFDASIKKADLYALHLMDRRQMVLAADITFDFAGHTIDDMEGHIVAKNIALQEGNKSLFSKEIRYATTKTNRQTQISLMSDFLDIDVRGKLSYLHLSSDINAYLQQLLPSVYPSKVAPSFTNDFEYKVNLHKDNQGLSFFFPDIQLKEELTLEGVFSKEQVSLLTNKTEVMYRKIIFHEVGMSLSATPIKATFASSIGQVNFTDSIFVQQVVVKAGLEQDSSTYSLQWKNTTTPKKNEGVCSGVLLFGHYPSVAIGVNNSTFYVQDSLWTIDKAEANITNQRVVLSGVSVHSQTQKIQVDGSIDKHNESGLDLSFKQFNLSNFDALTAFGKVDFDGILDGKLQLKNMFTHPIVLSDITINQFGVNQQTIGDAEFNFEWLEQDKALKVASSILYKGNIGTTKPVHIQGFYYPYRSSENLDIQVQLSNLKLMSLERYLTSFTSDFKGFASGNLVIKGELTNPDISGVARVACKKMTIDYLKTSYSFTHDITLTKNTIAFNRLLLHDEQGNTAFCKARLTHENFRQWTYDVALDASNLLCLDTKSKDNELFYGKGFASGKILIKGDTKQVLFDIQAKTEKGSKLAIPITSTSSIKDNQFIQFVSSKDSAVVVEDKKTPASLLGIEMNFKLEVTPEAEVQLIFDEKLGDIIRGSGTGNLDMQITKSGDFLMYGDFTVTKGDYLFTMQNIINKRFDIKPGGTITWNGNPYDALLDIEAIYELKAPLYDLISDLVSEVDNTAVAMYKKRYLVHCVLGLKQKLSYPDIQFDIVLPNIDNQTATYVSKYINDDNEQEKNRQMIGLLVMNRFLSPEGEGAGFQQAGTTTSREMLFNQLSNWLSKINDNLDVGINYMPGDEINAQELEVAMSTQLFNDRILIDGNIGTPMENDPSKNTSNIVGDVNIEYKITPEGRFRVKAFNRSNNDDLLKIQSPYTQGVGLFYRRDYDSFKELFKKKP